MKLLFLAVLILSCSCRSVQVISFEQFQDFQANSTIDTPKITEGWVVFSINGDTITSLHYEFFMIWRLRFPRRENIIVRYQGKILNDTTIVNWRRVPPHPDLDFNHSDTISTALQFVPFAQKTAIDSNYNFL